MFFDLLITFIDYILFACCIFILAGSIYITFKTRFIQIRFIPSLFKMLLNSFSAKAAEESSYTISPHKALFTAMSTTLGISSIVGPFIAIHLGGPGALLGYLLTAFFGSAAVYTEVNLGIQYRRRLESGVIMGGPMQYMKNLISPFAAKWYAICSVVLMTVWSGAQANQLVAIFDSPLLGDYRIPTLISGILTATILFTILIGGMKRVASISSKIVPAMFLIYVSACTWIIAQNTEMLGSMFAVMFKSAFSPYQMLSGVAVGGLISTFRWGIFKGTQTSEAGVGTQSIPHSMAETACGNSQAMLAMVSTYTSGFISFMSGCVALLTNTWQDPNHPLGMSMVAASFEMYFSSYGIAIVAISAFLFAFGTIIGNSYNGSQCLGYLTNNRGIVYYFLASSILVFFGAILEAKTVWSLIDIVLALMVVPHMSALILSLHRQPAVANTNPEVVLAEV